MSTEPNDGPAASEVVQAVRPGDIAPTSPPSEPPEEVELWWGAYSCWTMAPSFVVCLVLMGVIAWVSWRLMPEGWKRLTALLAATALWVGEFLFVGTRVFGHNYRLTTRHVWLTRGLRRMSLLSVELQRVARVTVQRSWLERRLGVGRVWVVPDDPALMPLILDGVRDPTHAADLIRDAVREARGEKT